MSESHTVVVDGSNSSTQTDSLDVVDTQTSHLKAYSCGEYPTTFPYTDEQLTKENDNETLKKMVKELVKQRDNERKTLKLTLEELNRTEHEKVELYSLLNTVEEELYDEKESLLHRTGVLEKETIESAEASHAKQLLLQNEVFKLQQQLTELQTKHLKTCNKKQMLKSQNEELLKDINTHNIKENALIESASSERQMNEKLKIEIQEVKKMYDELVVDAKLLTERLSERNKDIRKVDSTDKPMRVIEISFEESVSGCKKNVTIDKDNEMVEIALEIPKDVQNETVIEVNRNRFLIVVRKGFWWRTDGVVYYQRNGKTYHILNALNEYAYHQNTSLVALADVKVNSLVDLWNAAQHYIIDKTEVLRSENSFLHGQVNHLQQRLNSTKSEPSVQSLQSSTNTTEN
ncbi:hypothetical protein QTN25_005044 [Entamoeba marina]